MRVKQSSIHFIVAGAFAFAAAINIADFGDSPWDKWRLIFQCAGALFFLAIALRSRKSEAG